MCDSFGERGVASMPVSHIEQSVANVSDSFGKKGVASVLASHIEGGTTNV